MCLYVSQCCQRMILIMVFGKTWLYFLIVFSWRLGMWQVRRWASFRTLLPLCSTSIPTLSRECTSTRGTPPLRQSPHWTRGWGIRTCWIQASQSYKYKMRVQVFLLLFLFLSVTFMMDQYNLSVCLPLSVSIVFSVSAWKCSLCAPPWGQLPAVTPKYHRRHGHGSCKSFTFQK